MELGEIEMALQKHDGIKEAAVISDEDRRGETRITAYFVSRKSLHPPKAICGISQDKLRNT